MALNSQIKELDLSGSGIQTGSLDTLWPLYIPFEFFVVKKY